MHPTQMMWWQNWDDERAPNKIYAWSGLQQIVVPNNQLEYMNYGGLNFNSPVYYKLTVFQQLN